MIVNTPFLLLFKKLPKIFEKLHDFDLRILQFILKVTHHPLLDIFYVCILDFLLDLSVSDKQNHTLLFALF
jgi:hypothetical protein